MVTMEVDDEKGEHDRCGTVWIAGNNYHGASVMAISMFEPKH